MSSAVVQQQQLPPHSAVTRETYTSDSHSSRRNGRSGSTNATTPQRATYVSPSGASSAMNAQRAPDNMATSTYAQFYPETAVPGAPITLPIRTSSQQTPTTSAYDARGYTSKTQPPAGGYGNVNERNRESDNERRQRSQKSHREEESKAGRSRQSPAQSRSSTAIGQPPIDTSLPRENSAIIQHIVVDDPVSDLVREQARIAESRPSHPGTEPGAPPTADQTILPDPEKHRSRQDFRQTANRKEVKFGDYVLGQTLGEGEFGKVKMGWKKDSTVQVAIKLIRKESLQSNSNRLPKIYREITILRELQHPNIVRLHEFVETERHMGIILEYASGGELFDYILNHRYLKDPAARRLFAQLVSGVGYLHRKGIVHRDLKLENLLLDRNRNIIITDFGFANTFNPNDELGDEVEQRITDKEFVKREGLDKVNERNQRRGDLMQTSCGSPCYAAPELVVSDGLYTGRKVDVWSCGVILYAMLAGYLPFDDDPANPEGDNINLLYKYIVSTPLTFPEYVTPHARDLLRQILVPDPRRRADLFTVARHSWLSDYSHVVGFIGSSTKSDRDIAASAMQQVVVDGTVGRSASVHGTHGRSPVAISAGAPAKQSANSSDTEDARNKQRDAKRRTVQLEYVPPKNETIRGEPKSNTANLGTPVGSGRTRARGDEQGPVEVTSTPNHIPRKEVGSVAMGTVSNVRPGRDQVRATSEIPGQPTTSQGRPNTSGTLGSARLPSRGNSYSQPAMATPTTTNAQGRFSQPKGNSGYMVSTPMGANATGDALRPTSQQTPNHYGHPQPNREQLRPTQRGHKRSSTLGSIGDRLLGRSSSKRREQQQQQQQEQQTQVAAAAPVEKRDRRYPPVSMRNNISAGNDEIQPRPSTESSRRPSFGFNRKNSDNRSVNSQRNSRRFSFLPNFGGRKDQTQDVNGYSRRPESKAGPPPSAGMAFGRGASPSPSRSTTASTIPLYYDADRDAGRSTRHPEGITRAPSDNFNKALPPRPQTQSQAPTAENFPAPPSAQKKQWRDDGYGSNPVEKPASAPHTQGQMQGQFHAPNEPVERFHTPVESSNQEYQGQYGQYSYQPSGVGHDHDQEDTAVERSSIRPSQRKFAQEYDHGHAGSSSATRRVMDFFRRRGRERGDA